VSNGQSPGSLCLVSSTSGEPRSAVKAVGRVVAPAVASLSFMRFPDQQIQRAAEDVRCGIPSSHLGFQWEDTVGPIGTQGERFKVQVPGSRFWLRLPLTVERSIMRHMHSLRSTLIVGFIAATLSISMFGVPAIQSPGAFPAPLDP